MSRVMHFEIHASNPQALIDFYSGLFGWKFNKWEGPTDYWLIETGPADQPGINGGLLPRRGGRPPAAMQPVSSFICTVVIDSLDESLQRSASLGGMLLVPKMAIQ